MIKKTMLFVVLALVFTLNAKGAAGLQETNPLVETLQGLQADQIDDLRIADLQAMAGVKMTFRQKMAFKIAKAEYQWQKRKGADLNFADHYDHTERHFSIVGFLLGFFLGLIGVLIALLLGGNAFRSSLLGLLCWIIILLIYFLI